MNETCVAVALSLPRGTFGHLQLDNVLKVADGAFRGIWRECATTD